MECGGADSAPPLKNGHRGDFRVTERYEGVTPNPLRCPNPFRSVNTPPGAPWNPLKSILGKIGKIKCHL